ncbi:MAG: selenocysteine-specific translation elongation factor [Chloroflexi bacterium]|nr:selenocysteine-specific translation elongation factor [Chloroflexota bacterium]
MYVIGTAGHVDHGKSTLVKALTGIDPDRLEEEKRREMTIDLGFAWLKLPGGREISIIDVPGHERFIKNMLAGVGGVDAALLVIAADEGIMPQTQEHLDILKLLQIERGLVVLTKCDMVDTEWLELMTEEVRDKLKHSSPGLANAPIVPVSARTGQGLPELLKTLDGLLDNVPARPDMGRPRLPIDRVFSVSGFGTVVTGTLIDGKLSLGQEVEIQPGNLRSRIRSIQMHKTKAEAAGPGNRVAVNLTGLEVGELHRGMMLTVPGWLEATDRLDLRVEMLGDSPVELTQNSRWDFFSGSAEATAGVTILDKPKLLPGETGLVQVRLSEPMPIARGDRFILRLPSPSQTIAGGIVIDPHPRRHKRFQEEVLQTLKTLEKGTPAEITLQRLNTGTRLPRDIRSVAEEAGSDLKETQAALAELVKQGTAFLLSDDAEVKEQALKAGEAVVLAPSQVVVGGAAWQELIERSVGLVKQFHGQFPLRRGMGREELKSRLGIASAKTHNFVVNRLLAEQALVETEAKQGGNPALSLPGFEVKFNPAQQKQAENLLAAFRQSPFTPPNVGELGTDPNIVAVLVDRAELKRVSETVYFLGETYDLMLKAILEKLDQQEQITLAEVRDMFNASRKPVQTLLEYLDEQKITRRVGDARVRW